MKRYSIRPKAWVPHVDYSQSDVRDGAEVTVYERDRSPRPSGLLDQNGNQIFVSDELDIGFLKDEL